MFIWYLLLWLSHESGSSASSILEMRIWQGLSEPQTHTLDLCAAVDISRIGRLHACCTHCSGCCIPLALPFPVTPMPSNHKCLVPETLAQSTFEKGWEEIGGKYPDSSFLREQLWGVFHNISHGFPGWLPPSPTVVTCPRKHFAWLSFYGVSSSKCH